MSCFIKDIKAIEILDSRGNPTVEATVILESGASASASVPSGASVGKHEAHELRDGDNSRYNGKGVLRATEAVNGEIRERLVGENALCQERIDKAMIGLDGTENKERLGANSILAVSLAVARCAARELGLPLYRYLGGTSATSLPCPMLNILNGGAHASNNVEMQEFMIVPIGAESFSDSMRIASEIYKKLGSILKENGYSTSVGDEGGFAPNLDSDEDACRLICEAIEKAGYSTNNVKIALDAASSEWYRGNEYKMPKTGRIYSADELIDYYEYLVKRYPIISIEDGLGEDDFTPWREMTDRLDSKILLVGDDLFVTNEERVRNGITVGIGNSVLIKPNQIGTLTETIRVIKLCQRYGYKPIVSHRSGDTEDSFIADLAVGLGVPYIKSGAPARGERLAKYNRIIQIEHELRHI